MKNIDKEIVGEKFGSLTVLNDCVRVQSRNAKSFKTKWKVRCECGNEFFVYRDALIRRKSMCCSICRPTGRRNTNLYHIYYGMIQRCYNKRNPRFAHYGGRGIVVCDEWRDSYDVFRVWSEENGYSPGKGLSIDRINNDGDYCPQNCQWITIGENSAKGNLGIQKNVSKLSFIYALSPSGEYVQITNIARFARENNLNLPCVYAAIHGRISSSYRGWKFISPESRP